MCTPFRWRPRACPGRAIDSQNSPKMGYLFTSVTQLRQRGLSRLLLLDGRQVFLRVAPGYLLHFVFGFLQLALAGN